MVLKMSTPKVIIIVLNWNGKKDTCECIESLKHINYPNYKILLVDNGSSDGSAQYFREKYPEVILIENEKNLGYSEGNNVGIRYAIKNNFEYILILNNDTIVDPGFLDELVDAAESDGKSGILGPKAYYAEPSNMIYYAGAKINWYTGQPKHIGQKKIDVGQFNQVKYVDFVAGCCMLIKKEVIEKIGLLPNDYFLLWEDIDYSVNAKRHGYELVYVPSSKIWHKESASIRKIKSKRLFLSARNRIIFYKKYAQKSQYFCSTMFFVLYQLPLNCFYLYATNRDKNIIICSLKGAIKGILNK